MISEHNIDANSIVGQILLQWTLGALSVCECPTELRNDMLTFFTSVTLKFKIIDGCPKIDRFLVRPNESSCMK